MTTCFCRDTEGKRMQHWVLLYVHRNRRLIRDGSPGRVLSSESGRGGPSTQVLTLRIIRTINVLFYYVWEQSIWGEQSGKNEGMWLNLQQNNLQEKSYLCLPVLIFILMHHFTMFESGQDVIFFYLKKKKKKKNETSAKKSSGKNSHPSVFQCFVDRVFVPLWLRLSLQLERI